MSRKLKSEGLQQCVVLHEGRLADQVIQYLNMYIVSSTDGTGNDWNVTVCLAQSN